MDKVFYKFEVFGGGEGFVDGLDIGVAG